MCRCASTDKVQNSGALEQGRHVELLREEESIELLFYFAGCQYLLFFLFTNTLRWVYTVGILASSSLAAAIRRTIFPPFIDLGAIELVFSQFLVDFIMPVTQPPAESHASTDIRLRLLYALPEVLSTPPARVEHGQRAKEHQHICPLRRSGFFRVVCRRSVQKRPGCAAELLHVRRAPGWGILTAI